MTISRRALKTAVLAMYAAVWGDTSPAADFFLRDGDRVVFLGDSITEQRLYTTYVEAYALTRYPKWKLRFRNTGWGGDTSWLRQRTHADEGQLFAASDESTQRQIAEPAIRDGLERDVLPFHPTVVTVSFGMNDHAYQAFRPDIFRAYALSQSITAEILVAHEARVVFLTPQPIEEHGPAPDQDVRNQSLRVCFKNPKRTDFLGDLIGLADKKRMKLK